MRTELLFSDYKYIYIVYYIYYILYILYINIYIAAIVVTIPNPCALCF